jgi:hypothetical protein
MYADRHDLSIIYSFYAKKHRILRKDDDGEEYFLNINQEW